LYPPAAVAPLARSICNNIYQYISLIYGPSYQNQTKQRAREEREQADVVAGSPIGRAELGNRRPFGLPSRCARCSSSPSLSLSLPLPRNISLPRARSLSWWPLLRPLPRRTPLPTSRSPKLRAPSLASRAPVPVRTAPVNHAALARCAATASRHARAARRPAPSASFLPHVASAGLVLLL